MSFLYNNIAAIAVAAVASVIAWMFGGARGDLLIPVVPWLFVLMTEIVLCYPQRHHDETTYEARARLWGDLRKSWLVRVVVIFLVLLLIPFANNGLCSRCDAELIATGVNADPPLSFLPFCVSRYDHLKVFSWFLIVLPSALAVHYGLTRRGKRLVIELLVWNGAALALLGFVQNVAGASAPFWSTTDGPSSMFFSTFGYPNMAGDYFTTLFGLAVALWRDRCEQTRRGDQGKGSSEGRDVDRFGLFWRRHYFLIPAAIFFFSALNTLSRAAILLVSLTAVIYFLHTLIVILSRMRKSRRVFIGVWSFVVFGLLVFFSAISMPEKMRHEVDSLGKDSALDRLTGKGQYHAEVATEIWTDHLLFGCGGWGYAHLCVPKMTEMNIDTKKLQSVGGANVHNDYLQFLVEHGLVGTGCLAAIVILLLWPVIRQWRSMVNDLRFKKHRELPPRPIVIFALPAPALFVLISASATFIHAFGDCPFRSCAVLDLFFISLAALPGFMPKQFEEGEGRPEFHHHHHHHHS